MDTGADVSPLKRDNVNPNQLDTDGTTKSLGTINNTLFIEEYDIRHMCHVVQRNFPIPGDGILGRDFFKKYGCNIDYAYSTLMLRDYKKKYPSQFMIVEKTIF